MIITLCIALVVLAIAFWFTSMYALWQKESGIDSKLLSIETVITCWDKSERMFRRGYYSAMLYVKHGAQWSNKRMASLFFMLFPNAQPAFAKRDVLTGLHQGPSSYFLMSISESRGQATRKTRRRRKIM
jgi:hypothetical protein